MNSGPKVFADLNAQVLAARQGLDRVARELERVGSEMDRARVSEGSAIGAIARARLLALESGRSLARLDSADHEARQALDKRHHAFLEAEKHLAELDREGTTAESGRETARTDRDRALQSLEELVVATRAGLSDESAWQDARARFDSERKVASSATEKAERAQRDREVKGKTFEDSKLFRYLWKQRYGFPEYRANRLTRYFDGKVARLARYEDAHRDYRFLVELPARLSAYAERLREDAEAARRHFDGLEEAALVSAGAPDLRTKLTQSERQLDTAEARVEAIETQRRDLVQRRGKLASGEDEHTQAALQILARRISTEDGSTLRADAAETDTSLDDVEVERLVKERSLLMDLERRRHALTQEHAVLVESVERVEDLRRRYRRHDWDSDQSVFRGGIDPAQSSAKC